MTAVVAAPLNRVHRVLDPTTDGALAPEDLERVLDEAHREGWDLVASIDGLFTTKERAVSTRRTLLILRKSLNFVAGDHSATVERVATGASVTDVVRCAAHAFGVRPIDVLSRPFKKTRHVTRARQVAAYVLRTTGLSYPEIGTALADMDHTSAMSACRNVEREPEMLAVARLIMPLEEQNGAAEEDE